MGFADTVEQAILNGLLQGPAFAGYPTLHVGLSTTAPAGDGSGVTEPSGGGYARVATTAADWAPATGTAPAAKSNSVTLTFPQATADWADGALLTHFTLHDAATGGNLVAFGALTTPKPVMSGDTASFPVGELTLQLGSLADFA